MFNRNTLKKFCRNTSSNNKINLVSCLENKIQHLKGEIIINIGKVMILLSYFLILIVL